jgi:hypothetical protein
VTTLEIERERERRLLLSWAKAGKRHLRRLLERDVSNKVTSHNVNSDSQFQISRVREMASMKQAEKALGGDEVANHSGVTSDGDAEAARANGGAAEPSDNRDAKSAVEDGKAASSLPSETTESVCGEASERNDHTGHTSVATAPVVVPKLKLSFLASRDEQDHHQPASERAIATPARAVPAPELGVPAQPPVLTPRQAPSDRAKSASLSPVRSERYPNISAWPLFLSPCRYRRVAKESADPAS